ncbi:helix-turn-helix domain-containing protein [Hyphomicrobium sp.]|jgi:AraC-like DNA-binding protein|uniref:helix-turn-helix domain-containing protein n=1 Tax=Hyphomicrobium sp. TaxID=82 RepID=UPI0035658ADA
MKGAIGDIRLSPSSDLDICDTEYCSRSGGFSAFREAISGAFMPWLIDYKSDVEFEARMACATSEIGSIARVRMSPVVAIRRSVELAKSSIDCLYANYVISGELHVEQGGHTTTAKCGDIVLYDSALPVRILEVNDGSYEDLAFRIPKTKLAQARNSGAIVDNVVITAEHMISPLSSCLTFLTQNMLTTSAEELRALQETCVALLPVAAGHASDRSEHADKIGLASNYYMRELMLFIESSIGDATLSPSSAADHLGISVRYVHKQFSGKGTTFSTYVMAKRLDLVRQDLISQACRHQPIFALAYRWGFNDLSTFIRAFKKKFGCSPRQYRLKF